MPLTNTGRNFIAGAIIDSGTPFDATNCRLGVGDSSTAFAAGQTDLQAASNKHRELVDSGPTLAGNVITMTATFEPGEANFAWEEFAVFNAASGGIMLTRKVESLGTKTSAEEWELTVELTIDIGS